jgi:hypothetical protein
MLSSEEQVVNSGLFLENYIGNVGENKFLIPLPSTEMKKSYLVGMFPYQGDGNAFDLSKSGDFQVILLAELEDSDGFKMRKLYDQFDIDSGYKVSRGVVTIANPELLCQSYQPEGVLPPDFQNSIPLYSYLVKGVDFVVLTMSGAFVNLLNSKSSNSPQAAVILGELAKINPLPVVWANDFDQRQPMGGGGVGSSSNPSVSRAPVLLTKSQKLAVRVRGKRPLTAHDLKEQTELNALTPLMIACWDDVDRVREILGPNMDVSVSNLSTLIQDQLPPWLGGCLAFSEGSIKHFAGQMWVANPTGKQSSACNGSISGLCVGSFQKPTPPIPSRPADRLTIVPFTYYGQIIEAVKNVKHTFNHLCYGTSDPDDVDSPWDDIFKKLLSQLESKEPKQLYKNVSVPVVMAAINTMFVKFGKVFHESFSAEDGLDFEKIREDFKSVLKLDVSALMSTELSKDDRVAQFSNLFVSAPVVVKEVVVNNDKVRGPKGGNNNKPVSDNKPGGGNKRGRENDKNRKDNKVPKKDLEKVPYEKQLCIPHIAHLFGAGNKCTKTDHKDGKKCARVHIAGPANGGDWDSKALDRVQEVVQNHMRSGDLKDTLLELVADAR